MDGSSVDIALSRIEAALARIERAADGNTGRAQGDLVQRHERLRTAVARSLSQLDQLLDGHDQAAAASAGQASGAGRASSAGQGA